MERIYLATGSNLGDKAANLSAALALIEDWVGSLVAVSGIYRTAAWGIFIGNFAPRVVHNMRAEP